VYPDGVHVVTIVQPNELFDSPDEAIDAAEDAVSEIDWIDFGQRAVCVVKVGDDVLDIHDIEIEYSNEGEENGSDGGTTAETTADTEGEDHEVD